MAHLRPTSSRAGARCDALRCLTVARRELMTYGNEHEGDYCVTHSGPALQQLRDREADALGASP